MSKICLKCKEEKDESLFSVDNKSKDKLRRYCKSCSNLQFKKWRNNNLDFIRKQDRVTHYKRTYNLSDEVAEALVENRIGICPLCSREDLLVVDHCHTTGKVRGFICSFCNSCLGYSRENKTTLQNLIEYLIHHD